MTSLCINDESTRLNQVIIGLGAPYQRDKEKVAAEMSEFPLVPDTDRKSEVLALTYPEETDLINEYADYVKTLRKYDVEVLLADPEAAYSFDYTCPRDIGFVIGDHFFIANMAVSSRREEIKTIQHHLTNIVPGKIIKLPGGCLLEGGDVILLKNKTVLVGMNQRSDFAGFEFLSHFLSSMDFHVIPVRHRQLHLDCCLNPLGQD
ncbi:MAG: arginine deiminase family protein, partial [Pseudomonadota bacterium]